MSPGAPRAVPDVTVIVPTRNRAGLVGRLLRQLVAIDDDLRYELIVIDEGSSDETPRLLDRFAADHGVIRVRNDPPRGLAGARNLGLQIATADYVAWIDDDDLTSRDRLRRQHAALVTSGSKWSCAGRVDIDDDLRVIGQHRCPVDDTGPAFLPALLRSNHLPTAAQGLLVERHLAVDVGGYDEKFRGAEDWEFCIRLAVEAAPHFLDEPLVGYRTGVASMSTDTALMDDAISAVVSKHADLYRRYDVVPDWPRIHESLMAADLLGSRWRSVTRAGRSFRAGPSLHRALRCGLVLVAPRWFAARSAARRVDQVSAAWRRQASEWLAEVPLA